MDLTALGASAVSLMTLLHRRSVTPGCPFPCNLIYCHPARSLHPSHPPSTKPQPPPRISKVDRNHQHTPGNRQPLTRPTSEPNPLPLPLAPVSPSAAHSRQSPCLCVCGWVKHGSRVGQGRAEGGSKGGSRQGWVKGGSRVGQGWVKGGSGEVSCDCGLEHV